MIAIIVAGGKGTRMGKISKTTPKSLLNIAGKPLIDYQLKLLKKYNFSRVFILTNYLAKPIMDYCGNGSKWNLKIRYFQEDLEMGTAGGFKEIEAKLKEDFIVIYGDILTNLNIKKLITEHRRRKKHIKKYIGSLVVHPNEHPYDSDLVEVDDKNKIIKWLSKPHSENLNYRNLVNAAFYILTPEICNYIPKSEKTDFGKDIFPSIINKGKHVLMAYKTPEYLKDTGTIQRYKETEYDVTTGKYAVNNLEIKKPAIFIDRDGVINKEVGDLKAAQEFELIPDSAEAIKKINRNNYYAVVISNQPVIAKGFCSLTDLSEIHKKMETLLGKIGAKLDAIYFCPHHPEKGHPGENKKYKIDCDCRKPRIGMIKQAVRDLNIDLERSFFIGDSTRDILTAQKAGIKFVGVKTGFGCRDTVFQDKINRKSIVIKKDLYSAVNSIFKQKK